MTSIAQSAHDNKPVPTSTFVMMTDAATKEPLASEPYLVRGVQGQIAGDGKAAQLAFEAAQWRDPRSQAAAYFLADRYFRTGDNTRGLLEVAALARLSPKGATAISPYLAAYARNPAYWPALKAMFRANPNLAEPALATLASSLATVPAVLALTDPRTKPGQASWLPPLLNTLVGAGDYFRAVAVWTRFTGNPRPQLIHDARFSDKSSPPPFNWALTSSTVGMAERQAGGRLHLVFYGQQDGFLATQLLLLGTGTYRISMQVSGDPVRSRSLNWSLWCDKASAPISSVTLDAAAKGWTFKVPKGCPAQWLRLAGASGEISQQVDVTIGAFKLERVGGNA
ncbi:MAG: hypothetical protein JO335_11880 [Sphingomonas sp.]|nr:hypothetical protein [Sphingomonas sp.]